MKKALMFLLAMSALDGATATIPSQNFIINSRFDDNDCKKNDCIFKTVDSVRGWIPDPEIQIGLGFIYNSHLGNDWVLDLAANSNGCVKQKVKNINPGVYTLKYEYAAREGTSLDDSQFTVDLNKKVLNKIQPLNYDVNVDSVDIEFQKNEGELRFCSVDGINKAKGALLKSVVMTKKSVSQSNQPSNNQQQSFSNSQKKQSKNQNLPQIFIDSHSNKCFQKEYSLEAGTVLITFDYFVNTKDSVKDSAVFVVLDGKAIYKLLPNEHAQNIRLKGEVAKGTHTLAFCAAGNSNEAMHQIAVSNILLLQQKK